MAHYKEQHENESHSSWLENIFIVEDVEPAVQLGTSDFLSHWNKVEFWLVFEALPILYQCNRFYGF